MDQMVETFSELQMLMLGFLDMTEKADFRNLPATLGETLQRLRRRADMAQLLLPDEAVTKLLGAKSCEAALLYLYLQSGRPLSEAAAS